MIHCDAHSFSNMAEARIRIEDWIEDEQLATDIRKYVMQNMKREEALDFLRLDYPQYAWSLLTLSRRMCHFGIKYVNHDTDLEEVWQAIQTELDGPGKLLGYRTMQRKIRENHGLAVPGRLVYNVMSEINPEGLQQRGCVCQTRRNQRRKTEMAYLLHFILFNFFHLFTNHNACRVIAVKYLFVKSLLNSTPTCTNTWPRIDIVLVMITIIVRTRLLAYHCLKYILTVTFS